MEHQRYHSAPGTSQPADLSRGIDAQTLFARHSYRIRNQDIIVTLLHLSRLIQRHRGATLALLGGDASFRSQVVNIQQQANFQMQYLQAQLAAGTTALQQSDHDQLKFGWLTVIKDWQNDDIHHSFEFHSHLLDLVLRACRELAAQVLDDAAGIDADSKACQRLEKNYLNPLRQLSQVCVVELFELVEFLARIRGLGTHMAAVGEGQPELESRVNFWLQEFNLRKARFDTDISLVTGHFIAAMPGLERLPALNMKLNYFINILTHEMAAQRTFQVPGHRLFLMGTEIIDGYLLVMDQANAIIRDQLYHMNQYCLETLSLNLEDLT